MNKRPPGNKNPGIPKKMKPLPFRNPFVVGSCLALCVSVAASAEDDASAGLSENYFLGDVPVVLSASRLAQPVSESPAAMSIIDREIIEASGATNIADVLRLVPGFQVSHISGENLTAQYHGFANQHPKRMQVLIDGRSVYHSAFGGVHWDTLPITLNDIERIEVLRGSNAATYGSNAFMGVVNIITRHASLDKGSEFSLLTGSSGTREVQWRFGDQIDNFNYRFTLDAFETDGYPNHIDHHTYWDSTGGPVAPASVITGTPLQPETTLYTLSREDSQVIGRFNLRGDYQAENGDSLLFELGYARNNRDNTLLDGKWEHLRPDEDLRSSSQSIKWSRQLADSGELSLQAYHNRLRSDTQHVDTLVDNTGGVLINSGPTLGGYKLINDRYDIELQHTLPEKDGWRTVWGVGARLDRLESRNFVIDNKDINRAQVRAFADTEKHFGADNQWVLNAGLMLEHQQDLGNYASPRIAINYHLDELNTIRLAAARAYRMPSMFEQNGETSLFALDPSPLNPLLPPFHYTVYSNQGMGVEPEEIRSIELGLVTTSGIEGVSMDIRIFREELRNYIDEVNHVDGCTTCDTSGFAGLTPHDLYIHENAGWMDMHGVDLQTRMEVSDRTTFIASASMVRARGMRIKKRDGVTGAVIDDQPIDDFVPSLTLSALWSHRFDQGWAGSLGLYHMSEMNWPNDGDRLAPYHRIDLRLAKKMRIAGADTQFEVIAQNALDNPYIEFRDDNHFERRLYLRVKVDMD